MERRLTHSFIQFKKCTWYRSKALGRVINQADVMLPIGVYNLVGET